MRNQRKQNWCSRSRNGKSNVCHHENVASNELAEWSSDKSLFETEDFENFAKDFSETVFNTVFQSSLRGEQGVALVMSNPETGNTFFNAMLEGEAFRKMLTDEHFATSVAIELSKFAYIGLLGDTKRFNNS